MWKQMSRHPLRVLCLAVVLLFGLTAGGTATGDGPATPQTGVEDPAASSVEPLLPDWHDWNELACAGYPNPVCNPNTDPSCICDPYCDPEINTQCVICENQCTGPKLDPIG